MPGADDQNSEVQPGAGEKKTIVPPVVDPPGAEDEEGDDLADFADPEKAKAEIKKLRGEAAKYRTKSKGLEGQMTALNEKFSKIQKAFGVEDEVDPETKVTELQAKNEALAIELSISQLSRAHNITADQDKYFRFLLSEKMGSLEENEEMTDEHVAEIALEVQKFSGKAPTSTGLNGNKKPSADSGKGALTVQAFVKMNTGEKSELYAKNPAEYTRLFSEAKEQKLLR